MEKYNQDIILRLRKELEIGENGNMISHFDRNVFLQELHNRYLK